MSTFERSTVDALPKIDVSSRSSGWSHAMAHAKASVSAAVRGLPIVTKVTLSFYAD